MAGTLADVFSSESSARASSADIREGRDFVFVDVGLLLWIDEGVSSFGNDLVIGDKIGRKEVGNSINFSSVGDTI